MSSSTVESSQRTNERNFHFTSIHFSRTFNRLQNVNFAREACTILIINSWIDSGISGDDNKKIITASNWSAANERTAMQVDVRRACICSEWKRNKTIHLSDQLMIDNIDTFYWRQKQVSVPRPHTGHASKRNEKQLLQLLLLIYSILVKRMAFTRFKSNNH